ncbi:hypothetical protein C2R22_07500 [Salinigranum rubrum]|uniref:Uncharacterized protein n=1 Tax=Salinigranum rubrum TaxID=755307 RepID=A0A2I8VHV5_9EURY|nr:hypothetical protein [Salinigranum rubrum]AUV81517.1 hypothetical protein C2R22_07500 [Salinigranum rubrum]
MLDSSDEALLLQRYGQIEQRLQSYDRTIHNSFYLSLVYVGAVVATITPLPDSPVVTLVVLAFSIFVSLGLLFWNVQVMEDRTESNRRKATVERILMNEHEFGDADHAWADVLGDQHRVQGIPVSPNESPSTTSNPGSSSDKDRLVLLYYLGLAVVFRVVSISYLASQVLSALV